MRIFNLIIMRKQRFEKLKSLYFQKGLERGYGLGQIAGRAEAKNRGCILASNVKEEVEQIMKENDNELS